MFVLVRDAYQPANCLTTLLNWLVALILTLLFALSSLPGAAKEVEDLYSAIVRNVDEAGALNEGFESGLEQVFIKLTGTAQVLSSPGVKAAVRKADQYVVGYDFLENATGSPLLKVDFSESLLTQVLEKEGIQLWGKDRPAILLWLIDSTADDETARDQTKRLVSIAMQRAGLPFSFAETLDTGLVASIESQGDRFREVAERSSAAVADGKADLVALLELKAHRRGWQGKITLLDDQFTGSNSANEIIQADKRELVKGLAARVASSISQRYLGMPKDSGQRNALNLVVSGLRTYQQFAKVQIYLSSLAPVKTVHLHSMVGDVVTFQALVTGGESALLSYIRLGSTLKRIDTPPESDTYQSNPGLSGNSVYFQLR